MKLLAIAACVPALAGFTSAAVVSVDIAGGTYTGAGVLNTTSNTWLRRNAAQTFAIDTQTVTVGLTGGWTAGSANATIDLFDDYLHNSGNVPARTFSLTGLDLAKTYGIVIYSTQNSSGGRGGRFDLITGTSGSLDPQETDGNSHSAFALGVNYVRYDAITPGAGGVISFDVINSAEGIAVMNGFEIQSIPEPAAALLGSLGMLCLLRRRRN